MRIEAKLHAPTGKICDAVLRLIEAVEAANREPVALFLSFADAKALRDEVRLPGRLSPPPKDGDKLWGVPIAYMEHGEQSFLYSEPRRLRSSCLELVPK